MTSSSTVVSSSVAESWTTVLLQTRASGASLSIMCHGTSVRITVSTRDLQADGEQSSNLSDQLQAFLDQPNDAETMKRLENWMVSPCLEKLETLFHSYERADSASLQDYFHTKTFFFQMNYKLENRNGSLAAIQQPLRSTPRRYLTLRVPQSDRAVSFARSRGIPCISASTLRMTRGSHAQGWEDSKPPSLVHIDGEQDLAFFKPAADRDSFERELRVLMRIGDVDPDRLLRTSRLIGLAQWDSDGSIAGLVMEHIAGAEPLLRAVEGAEPQVRSRWAVQLQGTVARLHQAGIVWGDAAAQNVLVDSQQRVWIVDFDYGRHQTQETDRREVAELVGYLKSGLSWAEWKAK